MTLENIVGKTLRTAGKVLISPVTGIYTALKDAKQGLLDNESDSTFSRLENVLTTAIGTVTNTAAAVVGKTMHDDDSSRFLARTLIDWAKISAGVVTSFTPYVVMHEFAHSTMGNLVGKGTAAVAVNRDIGGDVVKEIIPGVSSVSFLEFAGRYSPVTSVDSELANFMTSYAPQILTIPGVMMLHKGIKEKNPFIAGVGATFAYAGIGYVLNSPFSKPGHDFANMMGHAGITNQDAQFWASLALVGTTYAASSYISSKVSDGWNWVKDKYTKLPQNFPALAFTAAIGAALVANGQPNGVRSYIPKHDSPEQLVDMLGTVEMDYVQKLQNTQDPNEVLGEFENSEQQNLLVRAAILDAILDDPDRGLEVYRRIKASQRRTPNRITTLNRNVVTAFVDAYGGAEELMGHLAMHERPFFGHILLGAGLLDLDQHEDFVMGVRWTQGENLPVDQYQQGADPNEIARSSLNWRGVEDLIVVMAKEKDENLGSVVAITESGANRAAVASGLARAVNQEYMAYEEAREMTRDTLNLSMRTAFPMQGEELAGFAETYLNDNPVFLCGWLLRKGPEDKQEIADKLLERVDPHDYQNTVLSMMRVAFETEQHEYGAKLLINEIKENQNYLRDLSQIVVQEVPDEVFYRTWVEFPQDPLIAHYGYRAAGDLIVEGKRSLEDVKGEFTEHGLESYFPFVVANLPGRYISAGEFEGAKSFLEESADEYGVNMLAWVSLSLATGENYTSEFEDANDRNSYQRGMLQQFVRRNDAAKSREIFNDLEQRRRSDEVIEAQIMYLEGNKDEAYAVLEDLSDNPEFGGYASRVLDDLRQRD